MPQDRTLDGRDSGHGAFDARVTMRNYFSSYHLWTAIRMGERAEAVETAHSGRASFDLDHRSYVLAAILSA
jgi:hypothetical protein